MPTGRRRARRRRPRRGALVVVAAAALLPACRPAAPAARNLVLVLVDTLRADRLGLYGYERDTSPELTRFAAEGVLFRRHYAQAGCTWPSANSILTSRPPEFFLAAHPQAGFTIPAGSPSLAELLERRGFSTAAVSASIVVRNTPTKLNRRGGFGRGFQSFDESCRERSAACVNQRAFAALDELREPFFLYLHYMEPHAPYQPPRWHQRRFATGRPTQRWVRQGDPHPIGRQLYDREPGPSWSAGDVRHLADLYDEEIAFFDARFAELLRDLERRGVAPRTAVVLVSDHGEEILEHGHVSHCRDMAYENVLRTPLVMRLPGGPRGAVRDALSLNLDLVPTALDYLGVPYEAGAFDGRSLRPLIEDGTPVHRLAFAAQGRLRVVSDGRWKLRHDLETGAGQLYDLAADPGERQDLAASHPAERARLAAALEGWMRLAEGGLTPQERVRQARDNEAELEALGYL